jgi:hypothetical protein
MAYEPSWDNYWNDNLERMAYDNHPYLSGFDDAWDSVQNYSPVFQAMDEDERQQAFEEFWDFFIAGGHSRDELEYWVTERMDMYPFDFDWESWRTAYENSH